MKKAVCAVVIVWNYLYSNRPRAVDKSEEMNRPLNKRQWEGVRHFERLLEAWITVSPIGPEAMGRTAAKVETLEATILSLEQSGRALIGEHQGYFHPPELGQSCTHPRQRGVAVGKIRGSEGFSAFKEVDPSRLTFVGFPDFDPSPYLDPRGRAVFQDPLSCRMDAADYKGPPPPRLRVHASDSQRLRLFELLDASNRLGAHRLEEIEAGFGSGLFAVVKDMSIDRLILDSRGANLLERPAQRWIRTLATGDALVKLLLEDHHVARSSGNDLRDFYYLFRVSERRSARNYLSGVLDARRLSHLRALEQKVFKDGKVVVSLRTLAMGDTWAVELAQTAHLSLALNSRTAARDGLICLGRPLPRGSTLTGLVIDDYVNISLDHEDEICAPSEGARLAELMSKKYEEAKLIPNQKKAFRDETSASFWGIDLDGQRGLLRGSLKRAVPLVGLLLRVAHIGVSTAGLLEVLAGSIISLMLCRRRLLALLDSLFESYKGRDSSEVVVLDGKTKSDLLIIAVMIPLAVTNLRAKVSPRITATDASNWGEAATVGLVEQKIANEIYRHTLKKSLWVKLLSPSAAWHRSHGALSAEDEVPDGIEAYKSHPLWQLLAECLTYKLQYARARTGNRHINIGELRSILHAEEIHSLSHPSSREIYGSDSQVALGTLIKGRSSSPALNNELVRSLPVMLLRDMYHEGIYYETSVNRADDPTRGKKIRGPSREKPSWWTALAKGEFEEFDEWLRNLQIHPDEVSGLPPFSEILHGELREEAVDEEIKSMFVKALGKSRRNEEKDEDRAADREGLRYRQPEAGGLSLPTFRLKVQEEVVKDENHGLSPLGSLVSAEPETELGDDVTSSEDEIEEEANEDEMLSTEAAEITEAVEITEAEEEPAESALGSAGVGKVGGSSPSKEKKLSRRAVEKLQRFDRSQFVGLKEDEELCQAGFLDLFSGERGVAEELHRITGRWVLCFDITHSPEEDLSKRSLQREIEELVRHGAFLGLGGGPVCCSFSMAITPPVRDRLHPYGKENLSENMRRKVEDGNASIKWMVRLLKLALLMRIGVWLENPAGSWMFRLPIWLRFLREHPSISYWTVDYCRYGKAWRKRTRVATNTCLSGHKTLCSGGHTHQLLRGRSKKDKKSWTAVAQAYPRGVSLAIASGLGIHSKLVTWKGAFDPGLCAKAGEGRVGEAGNPGPRSVLKQNRGDLSKVTLVEAKTLAIQDRAWSGFRAWALELLTR